MTIQLSDCCKATIDLDKTKERPECYTCSKCGRIIGSPLSTHNTRDGIEETEKVLWCVERMLDGTYKSAEHKKLDILNYLKRTLTTHHQELQKAREEEREETREILRCISRIVEINATNLENYILGQMPIVQSELDQPTV